MPSKGKTHSEYRIVSIDPKTKKVYPLPYYDGYTNKRHAQITMQRLKKDYHHPGTLSLQKRVITLTEGEWKDA